MQRNAWRLIGKYTNPYNEIFREITDVSILILDIILIFIAFPKHKYTNVLHLSYAKICGNQ